MKVISTNIGAKTKIFWNGAYQLTGIYKYPTDTAIRLEQETVANDVVADRRVHGGIYKACYLFSSAQYPYWQKKYPHLEWNWGMFGENLTVEGLDETQVRIGNIYQIGTARVQITQPREPCFKLGIRFEDQKILGEFISHGFPGTYVRILDEGEVSVGDTMQLLQESSNPLTIQQFYNLLFARKKNPQLVNWAIENEALPERKREKLKKFL